MTRTSRNTFNEQLSQTCTFLDEDTLVTLLSSTPEFKYCKKLIQFEIKYFIDAGDSVKNVLLECSRIKWENVSDFKEFISLANMIKRQDIVLYILDAPREMKEQIEPLLVDAVWLDSSIIVKFGQHLINRSLPR